MASSDDRDDSGFDHTVAAGEQAPPARRVTAKPQPSPFRATLGAAPIANAETVASDSLPSTPSQRARSSTAGPRSTVGSEMRAASVERFTQVSADRFELLDELARGGLGRVFRARDPRTNRIVAIKEVLHPAPEILARFAREALVTANLQHPAIVPVYEVGRWPTGEPFYAMKLVEGRTLEQLVREAKTQAARIALLPHVIDVAGALAYAHGERVIHRDLKPANILVGAYGETIVIDWGLAKNLATGEEIEELPIATTLPPDQDSTVAGSVLGTPAYMPPEQALGERLDERADVYAIGAILYHALSGQRPFAQAKALDELIELVAYGSPTPLAQLAPELPPELVAIVEHAMDRDPARRYATAQGLAKDLRAFQAGKLVGAHRYTTWQRVRRWVGQHKATVATGAVALGLLVTVGAIGVWRIADERDEAQHQRALAQTARGLAERRFADSLQELARQALAAGDLARALPLVVGAVDAQASPSAALGVLAAQARAPYAALAAIIPSPPTGVAAATVAAAGDRMYTASGGDESVRAIDLATQRELWRVTAGYMVERSPDGVHLATATKRGELIILVAATGAEVARWRLTETTADLPSTLVWSPDNRHVAVANDTGALWLAAITGSPTQIATQSHGALALKFSPDGALLASTWSRTGDVLLHTTRGTLARRLTLPDAYAIDWLDAQHVLIGDAQRATSIDVRTGATASTLDHGEQIYGFLVGADWLLAYGHGPVATLWDRTTQTKRADLPGHNIAAEHAVVVGDWLVTGDELGNGFVWDPRTGERAQTLPRDSVVIGLATAGDRLVVIREARQELWQLPRNDAAIALIRRITGHTARIRDLVFDGTEVLWTASNDGSVRRTSLAGGEPRVFGSAGYREQIRTLGDPDVSKPPYAHGMRALERVGDVLITANEDGALIAWDATSGAQRTTFVGHTGRVREVALSPDQRTLYSVGDTTVRRWDLASGRLLASAELGITGWDVGVFPDGTVVTLGDVSPGVLALWSPELQARPAKLEPVFTRELLFAGDRLLVSTQTQLYQLDSAGDIHASAPQPKVFTAAVSERFIVAGDPRGDVVLRDRATGATVRSWTAGEGIVVAVAFSPDGDLVATISGDRVRIWDPHTGTLLAATAQLPAVLTLLAWSPDSRRLAFAGSSGTAWVWDVRPQASLAGLAEFSRCVSPWRLADASVVKAAFDPAACAVLTR